MADYSGFTYYYIFHSTLHTGQVKTFTSVSRAWCHVLNDLRRTLGIDADKNCLLRAKIVANTQWDEGCKFAADAWRQRANAMPFLKPCTALEAGDVLIVYRVPRFSDVRERIYGAGKRARVKDVPMHLNRLIRPTMDPSDDTIHREVEIKDSDANEPCTTAVQAQLPATILFDENMSEADRINALVQHNVQMTADSSANFRYSNSYGPVQRGHPRRHRYRQERPRVPPPDYVCKRCNIAGHWVHDCPTKDDRRFDPSRVVSCNGMSRALLKRITEMPSDPDAVVYKDQEGRLYVRRDNVHDRARESGQRSFEMLMGTTRQLSQCHNETK